MVGESPWDRLKSDKSNRVNLPLKGSPGVFSCCWRVSRSAFPASMPRSGSRRTPTPEIWFSQGGIGYFWRSGLHCCCSFGESLHTSALTILLVRGRVLTASAALVSLVLNTVSLALLSMLSLADYHLPDNPRVHLGIAAGVAVVIAGAALTGVLLKLGLHPANQAGTNPIPKGVRGNPGTPGPGGSPKIPLRPDPWY